MFAFEDFNQGIALDIFPLDNADEVETAPVYNEISALAYDCSTLMRRNHPCLSKENLRRISECRNTDLTDNLRRIDELARLRNDAHSAKIACLVCTLLKFSRQIYDRSWFESYSTLEFEGHRMAAPVGWNQVLLVQYGDYLCLPDVSHRSSPHVGVRVDPDRPYAELIADVRNDLKRGAVV